MTARFPLEETGAVEVRTRTDGWKGLFAAKPVSAASIVVPGWHETFYLGIPGWRNFTVREIAALPPDQRALVIQYGLDEDFDRIVGPTEKAAVITADNYINHSCDPNLGYDFRGNVIADRDIPAGAELTIDYGCFAVNFDEAWDCQCGSANCRKRVRRDDWQRIAKQRGLAMPRFLHSRIADMSK